MDRARASDSPEVCPLVKSGRSPSRHKGRPKLLNLPPEAKHPADPQRNFKTKTRTPEERPKWPQEEVRFWLALGKWREGLRAKVSMQPTGQNASQRSTCSVMRLCHGRSASRWPPAVIEF